MQFRKAIRQKFNASIALKDGVQLNAFVALIYYEFFLLFDNPLATEFYAVASLVLGGSTGAFKPRERN